MRASLAAAVVAVFLASASLLSQTAPTQPPSRAASQSPFQDRVPDSPRQLAQQADTDKTWREASEGIMQMEKITFRSKVGDLDIPAFVFQPLHLRGPKGHPAIVWVHENIRGHLYEHYIAYIREATAKGYLVIAPEYRGRIGYGRPFYDAID